MHNKDDIQRPALGIAIIIKNGNKVLIGKRLTSPMFGSWQLPGGWVYNGETPEQAVHRKIKQFTGLKYNQIQHVTYTNNIFDQGEYSLSLYFQLDCLNAEQINLCDNTDCENWQWVKWAELSDNLFLPLKVLKNDGFTPNNIDVLSK